MNARRKASLSKQAESIRCDMDYYVFRKNLCRIEINKLEDYCRRVHQKAEEGAQMLYCISNVECSSIPKYHQWYCVATSFPTLQTNDTVNREIVKNAAAFFGSAVEEYVNLSINISIPPPHGYTARIQVPQPSGTIPDIVLYNSEGREIAWLDLTNEGNFNHIRNKSGDWEKARDFVAEIFYSNFDPSNIVLDDDSSIASHSIRRMQRAAGLLDRLRMNFMKNLMVKVIRKMRRAIIKNPTTFTNCLIEMFGLPLQDNYRHPIVRSMLMLYLQDKDYVKERDEARFWLREYEIAGCDKAAALKYIDDCFDKCEMEKTLDTVFEGDEEESSFDAESFFDDPLDFDYIP